MRAILHPCPLGALDKEKWRGQVGQRHFHDKYSNLLTTFSPHPVTDSLGQLGAGYSNALVTVYSCVSIESDDLCTS